MKHMNVDRWIPLKPAQFAVLLTLNDGAHHGYAIMKEVRERTGGTSILGPGSLYRVLKEMTDDGLIERSAFRPAGDDDERRQYYAITELGHRVGAAEAARMDRLVLAARSGKMLGGSGDTQ